MSIGVAVVASSDGVVASSGEVACCVEPISVVTAVVASVVSRSVVGTSVDAVEAQEGSPAMVTNQQSF